LLLDNPLLNGFKMPNLFKILLLSALSLCFDNANALDSQNLPDLKPGIATIQLAEPQRHVAYTVGDVLSRDIIITIKKPYALIKESLPIVGYEKRYKGKPIGIDLSAITHTAIDQNDATVHKISLSYQIWTNNVVAKAGALPAEYLHVINTAKKGKDQEIVKLRIPSWSFAISPISTFGQVKVEDDMTGFRGPIYLNNVAEKNRLNWLLALLGFSLLGLLYILGKHAWLPRMGGPFASTFRQLRRLPNTPQGLQTAVESLHGALNKTAGVTLFSDNLDSFLAKNGHFKTVKSEILQFFALSRQVFFEPNAKHSIENPQAWLQQFVRRLRDCERGLTPDTKA
jgi:mxaA protein